MRLAGWRPSFSESRDLASTTDSGGEVEEQESLVLRALQGIKMQLFAEEEVSSSHMRELSPDLQKIEMKINYWGA